MSAPRRPRRPVTGILLFDKPPGCSSNQALQRVKHLYQAEKAGHTGSLDPLATGLLPICLGEATKLSPYLLDADKRYRVRARLGEKTATADAEGAVIARSDPAGVTAEALTAALSGFRGEIQQIPPMYSALKHEGRRLYELARAGLEVERAERTQRITELRLLAFECPFFELEVLCSKGTYVRTLVEDIAASLGQVAHVAALRRLEVAPFHAPQMATLEQLERDAEAGLEALDRRLLAPAAAVGHLAQVEVDEDRRYYLSRGQAVRVAGAPRDVPVAVLGAGGDLLGIAEVNADGLLAPRRWMSAVGR